MIRLNNSDAIISNMQTE